MAETGDRGAGGGAEPGKGGDGGGRAEAPLSPVTSDKLETDEEGRDNECQPQINKYLNSIFVSSQASAYCNPDPLLHYSSTSPNKSDNNQAEFVETDGRIVETLVIPKLCLLGKDVSSPTNLPSESDKDSGISVPSTPVISYREFTLASTRGGEGNRSFCGTTNDGSKGENDFTDASEIDDDREEEEEEDEEASETCRMESSRSKSPFGRKVWNRRNGVYKVRPGIMGFCLPSPVSQSNQKLIPVQNFENLDFRSELARMRMDIARMKEEMEVIDYFTDCEEQAENEDEASEEYEELSDDNNGEVSKEYLDRSLADEYSTDSESDFYLSDPGTSEYSSSEDEDSG